MQFEKLEPEDYPAFLALYESAFPPEERRAYSGVSALVHFISEKEGRFQILVVKEADEFVGFVTYWTFPDYVYVEHVAVSAEHRGNKIGSAIFQHLYEVVGDKILLEVEHPTTEQSRRRLRFYERLGFLSHPDIDYLQPPYQRFLPSVPLMLMTHGDVDLSDWERAVRPMQREVYGV